MGQAVHIIGGGAEGETDAPLLTRVRTRRPGMNRLLQRQAEAAREVASIPDTHDSWH